jgi:2-isopropylmalate synthase
VRLGADVTIARRHLRVDGTGTGPIDAFVDGLVQQTGTRIRVLDYHEHSIGSGADARAIAYLELRIGESGDGGQTRFGVGIDTNIVSASLKAIASAMNRAQGVSFGTDRHASVA